MDTRGIKRKSVSVRLEAIMRVQSGETLKKVAKEYNVSPQSVRNWVRKKELIGETADQVGPSAIKCRDKSHVFALRQAVYEWYVEQRKKELPVTKRYIKSKAIELNAAMGGPADFRASEGWVWNFKKSIGVICKKNSTEETISPDTDAVLAYRYRLHSLVQGRGLTPDQVYNADESGLYFKCLPNTTLDSKEELNTPGVKDRNRISILFCSNATGDHKLPLLIIGKTVNFLPVSKESRGKLPVVYTCSKKAWMTSKIFEAWVRGQFEPQVKQYLESKKLPLKAVLLVDNAASHRLPQKTIGIVTIEYLPADVSPLTQPMEQGVIALFRRMYRLYLLQRLEKDVNFLEELNKLSMIAALNLAAKAWDNIKPGILAKSWKTISLNSKRPDSPTTVQSLERKWENELIQSAQKIPGLNNLNHKQIVEWCESDPLDVSGDISEEEYAFLNPNRSLETDSDLTISHEEGAAALDRAYLYAKQFSQWAPYMEGLLKMRDEAAKLSSVNMEEDCVKEEILSDDDDQELHLDDDPELSGYEEKLFLASDLKIESGNNLFESEDNDCIGNVDEDPLYVPPDSGCLVQDIPGENQERIKEETQDTDEKSIVDQSERVESSQSTGCVNEKFALDSAKDEERRFTVMYNSLEDEGVSSCSFTSKEGEAPHETLTKLSCDFLESTSQNGALSHSVTVSKSGNSVTVPQSGDSVTVPQSGDSVTVPHSGDSVTVSHYGDSVTVPFSGDSVTVSQSGDSVIVSQSGDSVTVSQSGDSVTVPQSGNSVTVPHSGDSVTVSHYGDSVTVPFSGDSVTAPQSGDSVTVSHSGDSVTAPQSDDSVTVSHSGDSVSVPHGSGDSVTVSHSGDSVNLQIETNSSESTDITKKRYFCELCEKKFSSNSDLKDHQRSHWIERPFECDQCERRFTRKLDLRRHQRTHTGEKPFQCSQCEKKFAQKHNLTMHKQAHSGKKPFECDHCEMKFFRMGDLVRHKQFPDGGKPFECNQCGRTFCNEHALKVHQGAHCVEKTFNCKECGRNFWKKMDLQRHQRIHSGEKPFQCDQCELSFAQKIHLVVHKRLHSGKRPFKCGQCDQTFSRKDTLKVHLRVHSGNQQYKCD